ncbi:hypothetical protein LJB96_02495 [Methanobrevibacter sp. OttesenSCG-928-K11]|nr:hypothetical protein [Methanobrevibacter sp. OttesenSCG-928-K11]MDL2270673.1 hypothetical protein [Methanobrevibacter sp. OttesenSCG-928-I08]
MAYEIENAIIRKDKDGNLTLIDPGNHFNDKDVFVAIDSDDLITIQLLINSIINNDFKKWRTISKFNDADKIKSLFIRLGYTKEDIAKLLKEF